MAKSQAELNAAEKASAAKNTVARERIASELQGDTLTAVVRLIGVNQENLAKLQGEKAKTTAKFKSDLVRVVGDVDKARLSGSVGARLRAQTELAKLLVTAPIDFAKAAYARDEALLMEISKQIPESSKATDKAANDRRAWEIYLKAAPNQAGNVLGTYERMVELYGVPSKSVQASNDPILWKNLQDLEKRKELELIEAATFRNNLQYIQDDAGAYANYLEKTKKPDNEQTATEFAEYYGAKDRLASTDSPAWIKTLSKVASDPKAFSDEAFRSDYDTAIENQKSELEYAKSLLPKETTADSADTFRDKLAAWLGREDTQWWAEKNGLSIGTLVPRTPELEAEIKAGQYPGAVFTKYGVYMSKPDDMKAFNLGMQQIKQRPEQRLFRAAGVGQGNIPVEITLNEQERGTEAPSTSKAMKVGLVKNGTTRVGVALLENGEYAVSNDDGKTWEPVERGAGEALAKQANLQDEFEPFDVPVKVTGAAGPKKILGVYRKPHIDDAVGSVRYVDAETGKEVYVPPEKLGGTFFPGKRPDWTPTTLQDTIRKGVAGQAIKKSGLSLDENSAPKPLKQEEPPKTPAPPTDYEVSTRKAEQDAFRATQAELAAEPPEGARQPPVISRPDPSKPASLGTPRQPEYKEGTPVTFPTQEIKAQKPTVPQTVTPTVNVDPRKKLYAEQSRLPRGITPVTYQE